MKFFQPEMDELQGCWDVRAEKPMAYCLFLFVCFILASGLSGTYLGSFLLRYVAELLTYFQSVVAVDSMPTFFLVMILTSLLVLLHCCFDQTWLMSVHTTSRLADCAHQSCLEELQDKDLSGWNIPGRLLGELEYATTESYPLLCVDGITCRVDVGSTQGRDDGSGVDTVDEVKQDVQCRPDTSQQMTENCSSCCWCSERSDIQEETDLKSSPVKYVVDPMESSIDETHQCPGELSFTPGPWKTQCTATQTDLAAQNHYVTVGTMTSHPETVDVAVGSQKRYKVVRHVDTCTTGLFMKKLRRAQRVMREARLKFQSDQRTKLDTYRTVLTRYGGRLHVLSHSLQRKDMLLSCTAVTRAISASEIKDICTAVSSARDRLVTQCKLNFALKEVVDSKCEPPPADSQMQTS